MQFRYSNQKYLPKLVQCIAGRTVLMHSLIVIAVGIALYANTLSVPFLFDDLLFVANNKAVSTYFDTSVSMAEKYAKLPPEIAISMGARRVTYFTFALNYLVHGLDVTGYHIVNLLIHLAAALAVYALVSTLLKTPFFSDHPAGLLCPGFPLVTALLFVSHPIQTSAVTYITQRFDSLATLFYLLSIMLFLKARMEKSVKHQAAFLAASVTVAALGMYTKETVFTLPIIAIVCEIMFFRAKWARRILFLLPLLCTMLIIPLNMMSHMGTTGSASEVFDASINSDNLTNVSQKEYLLTQFRVIVTYLRLLLVPVNQHLDYDYPRYSSLFDPSVAMSALFLSGIVLLAAWAYCRSHIKSHNAWQLRLFSFGVAWFFITISMSSSIIPLDDMIFEYRLYLPSTGLFIAVIASGMLVWQKLGLSKAHISKIATAGVVLILAVLCVATVSRNYVWRDPVRFWEDNVAKAPNKARPHQYLSICYKNAGRYAEVVEQDMIRIRLSPKSPSNYQLWNDIAVYYMNLGRGDEAFAAIDNALALKPGDPRLLITLEWLSDSFGRRAEASEQRRAVKGLQ